MEKKVVVPPLAPRQGVPEDLKLVINIPEDPSGRQLGYLSNSSLYPMMIDGKKWMSIEHFLIGMQFKNTDLGSAVLRAKNMMQVKLICRPKRVTEMDEDGRISRRLIYGARNTPLGSIRATARNTPLDDIKEKYLESAVKAKFDQNTSIRKKLLSTKGTTMVDHADPQNLLGKILVKVRDGYILETTGKDELSYFLSKETNLDISDRKTPLGGSNTFSSVKGIVDGIVRIALIIKDKEGLDKLYPEMFEDALYSAGLGETYYKGLTSWMASMTADWSKVMSKMPNFYEMFKNVESHLISKKLPRYMENEYIQTALLLTVFIKWYLDTTTGAGAGGGTVDDSGYRVCKTITSNIFMLRSNTIIIPAKSRRYRVGPPRKVNPSIPRSGPKTFKDRYVPGGTRGDDIIVIMDVAEKNITLHIEEMEMYRPQIVAAGGKITSPTTVKFHYSKLADVENMIYTVLRTNEDRYDMVCKCWAHRRISIVDDIMGELKLIDPSLSDSDLLRRAAKLLGLKFLKLSEDQGKSIPSIPDYITEEVKERGMPLALLRKLSHHFVTSREKILDLISRGSTISEVMTGMDNEGGWRHDVVPRKTDVGDLVCRSMENILSFDSKISLVPPEEKIFAFMILLPKDLREKARAYTKSNISKFREMMGDIPDLERADASEFSKKILPAHRSIHPRISVDVIYVVAYSFIMDHIKKGMSVTRIVDRCKLFGVCDLVMSPGDGKKIPIAPGAPGVSVADSIKNSGVVVECEGNLLTFTDSKWICVIANTTSLSVPKKSGTRSEVVTREVYDKYTYSNVYTAPNRTGAYTPGNIIVSIPRDRNTGNQLSSTVDHRYVITLFAAWSSGGPKKITDTKQAREEWFSSSIDVLSKEVKAGDTLAFSSSSLSDGYHDILIALAKKINVKIYILSSSDSDAKISKPSILVGTVDGSYTGRSSSRGDDVVEASKDAPLPPLKILNFDTEDKRGALYIKLFKKFLDPPKGEISAPGVPSKPPPRGGAGTLVPRYSNIVGILEAMTPKNRTTWLTKFSSADETTKKNMLASLETT